MFPSALLFGRQEGSLSEDVDKSKPSGNRLTEVQLHWKRSLSLRWFCKSFLSSFLENFKLISVDFDSFR